MQRVWALRGKLGLAEKRRDRLQAQLVDLQKHYEETTERLSIITRDTPELESQKANVRVLQNVVEDLNRSLHRLSLEKQELGKRQAAAADEDYESKAGERIAKKEQTLKKLYQDHNEALIREKKDVEALQRLLGVIDPAAAAQQHALLEAKTCDGGQFDLFAHHATGEPGAGRRPLET